MQSVITCYFFSFVNLHSSNLMYEIYLKKTLSHLRTLILWHNVCGCIGAITKHEKVLSFSAMNRGRELVCLNYFNY